MSKKLPIPRTDDPREIDYWRLSVGNPSPVVGGTATRTYKYVVALDGSGDYLTIGSALSALGTNPGAILIREGTYVNETTPLRITTGQYLHGSGVGITIIKPKASASGNGIIEFYTQDWGGVQDFTNCGIFDLEIDGSLTTNVVAGIYSPITYVDDHESFNPIRFIHRVRVNRMKGRGISLNSSGPWSLDHVDLSLNKRSGLYLSHFIHGPFTNSVFIRNGADNVTGDNYGFFCDGGVQAINLVYCVCGDNPGGGFYIKATHGYEDMIKMIGCLSENTAYSTPALKLENHRDCSIVGGTYVATGVGVELVNCTNSSIVGNAFLVCSEGIKLTDCTNITMCSNSFDSNVYYAGATYGSCSLLSFYGNSINSVRDVHFVAYPKSSAFVLTKSTGLVLATSDVLGSANVFRFYSNGAITRDSDGLSVTWA